MPLHAARPPLVRPDARPGRNAGGTVAAAPAAAATRLPRRGCGTVRPNLDAIETAEGLVIAPDGTFYFTQPFGTGSSAFLGRYRPPYTPPELQWLEIGGKALGVTLDPKKNILYAGSRERKKLLAITSGRRR